MLVVYLKRNDFNTQVTEIEGKIPDVSNLVKTTDLDTKSKKKIVIELLKIRLDTCWLKMKYKNYKNLILLILEVKVILKKMVHKAIQFFSQYINVLKRFQTVIIYTLGNLKVCLMKLLILLLHLTIK